MRVQVDAGVVDALAAARLARFLHADVLSEPLRDRWVRWCYKRAGAWPGDDIAISNPERDWPTLHRRAPRAAHLLGCRWCVAVWCSVAVVCARRVAPRVWEPCARVLAYSYTAGALGGIER